MFRFFPIYILLLVFLMHTPYAAAQHTLINTHSDLAYRTGLELFDKGLYEAAKYNFKQYLELGGRDDKSADAAYKMALCALERNDLDADLLLEDFIRKFPDHPETINAYMEWGNRYYQNQLYEKAVGYFEKVPEKSLTYSEKQEFNLKLGKSYFYVENYPKAEKCFQYLIDSDQIPYRYSGYYFKGYMAYLAQVYEEALKNFAKCATSKEYELQTPILIVSSYYETERYDQLIEYADTLLNDESHPKDYLQIKDINLLTADACYALSDYNNALIYFSNYRGLNSDSIPAEVDYRIGFCKFQTQDYGNAIESFRDIALREDETGQYAAYYLGCSYLKVSNKLFAINAFELARKRDFNPDIKENCTFLIGQLYFDTEQYSMAIDALQDFTIRYPQSANFNKASDLLSKSYFYSREYNLAIQHIERLPYKDENIKRTYQQLTFSRGIDYYNAGKYEESILDFEKSIQNAVLNDLNLKTAYWLAESYSLKFYASEEDYKNNLSAKVIPLYEEILNIYDEENNIYALKSLYGLGYAYFNLDQYEKSMNFFQRFLTQANPGQMKNYVEDATLRNADCYYALKQYEDASDIYKDAIRKQFADQDYALYQTGIIAVANEDFTQAKRNFKDLIQNYPGSLYIDQSSYQLGMIDLLAGRYAVSIEEFSNIILDKPDSPVRSMALLRRGIALQNIGKDEEAILDFKEIVQKYTLLPIAEEALDYLQDLLEEKGRDAEFVPLMTLFVDSNPNSKAPEKVDFERAKRSYFNQQYQTAMPQFKQFLERYSQSALEADAMFFLAECNYRTGNEEEALKIYKAMIQNPVKSNYFENALEQIALLEYKQQDYKSAIRYYFMLSSNTESKREQINAFTGIMKSYYALQIYDSTLYFAYQIIRINTYNLQEANFYTAKSYYYQNNLPEAANLFRSLASLDVSVMGAESQYLLAEILFKQNQYEESLKVLTEFGKKFSNFEEWRAKAYLLIADNYIKTGEEFQAKATLQSIIDHSKDPAVVEKAQNKLNSL